MKNIEVELKSFVSEERYQTLLTYFHKEAEFLGQDEQITYYFDCPEDFRIQQSGNYSKICLKKGKVHDYQREEYEVRCAKEDFEKLEKMFSLLGYKPEIKWFRNRHSFKWGDVDVAVDSTRGYGNIIELEKMSDETGKDRALVELREKLNELGIPLTPKEEFTEKFEYYKTHWQELV